MRILVTDGMDKTAMAQLREAGHEVVEQFYEPDQLGAALREFDAVVVRSKTKVRANHIDEAKGGKLKLIIRGGVGVDNIDVKYAEEAGTILNICPLLNMNRLGQLIPREKIRTKKKVIQAIVTRMKECADNGTDYSGKCYISHSACYEDARAVADLVEAAFPKLNGKVEIYSVGTTIGSHTGPGTVALFFWGKERNYD